MKASFIINKIQVLSSRVDCDKIKKYQCFERLEEGAPSGKEEGILYGVIF